MHWEVGTSYFPRSSKKMQLFSPLGEVYPKENLEVAQDCVKWPEIIFFHIAREASLSMTTMWLEKAGPHVKAAQSKNVLLFPEDKPWHNTRKLFQVSLVNKPQSACPQRDSQVSSTEDQTLVLWCLVCVCVCGRVYVCAGWAAPFWTAQLCELRTDSGPATFRCCSKWISIFSNRTTVLYLLKAFSDSIHQWHVVQNHTKLILALVGNSQHFLPHLICVRVDVIVFHL